MTGYCTKSKDKEQLAFIVKFSKLLMLSQGHDLDFPASANSNFRPEKTDEKTGMESE